MRRNWQISTEMPYSPCSNSGGITNKRRLQLPNGLGKFLLNNLLSRSDFIQKLREQNVTVETNALKERNGNSGSDHVAVRERCIYPNLKLRVYTTGMRQNRLARLVGIDEAYLSRIINGVRVPGKQMQEQIAQVLGCDAEWLFQQATVQIPVQMHGNKGE
jgi:hypothetical protein